MSNSTPEGWKLVPIVPTDEMLNAAFERYRHTTITITDRERFTLYLKYDYQAMVEAAPNSEVKL